MNPPGEAATEEPRQESQIYAVSGPLHPKSSAKVASGRDRRDASFLRHLRRRFSNQLTRLYPVVGWFALFWRWLLQRTIRVDRRGAAFDLLERGEPFIFTYWHQDQLPLLFDMSRAFSYMSPLYMLSPGRTGALSSSVLGVVGVSTVAGSGTHKGWKAIEILTHLVKVKRRSVFILADGSRGPNMEARWGSVTLARDTGLPIIAGRAWGNNLLTLNWTWMKLVIPLPRPWGRTVVLTSEPLYVKPDATREELSEYRDELQRRLDQLTRASLDYFEGRPEAADPFGARRKEFPVLGTPPGEVADQPARY